MSDNKIKVSSLAQELGIPSKDLLNTLKGMDIAAKTGQSSISADDAVRVRRQHGVANPNPSAIRKEVQSPVIVRRRHTKSEDEDASLTATDAQTVPEEAVVETAAPAHDETAPSAHEAEQDSVSLATVAVAPPVMDHAPETLVAVVAEEKNTVTDTENAVETPKMEKTSAHHASSTDAGKEKAKAVRPKKERPPRPESAPARIISMPDTTPPAPVTAVVAPEPVVPVLTAVTANNAPAETVEKAEKTEQAEHAQKAARLAAPDASAKPEGSSAPTLPPVRSDHPRRPLPGEGADEAGEHETEEQRRKRKRRPPEVAAPQVRVISRPDAAEIAQRREANAQPAAPVERRRPYQGDNAPRPAYPNTRPANTGGAPAGAPRPYNNSPRPDAPAGLGMPPTEGDSQSKKKRNKGRRLVDFQGDNAVRSRSDDDDMPRMGRGKRRNKGKEIRQISSTQPLKAAKRKLRIEEAIRVADMAHQMGLKSTEIIKVLFGLGIMATINQSLDIDTATLVAAEFDYEVEKVGFSESDYLVPAEADAPEDLKPRPPVVTIMGHVDHGKTSLLDAIRKTNVTSGEAGGITQHIGAYHVKTKRGDIVFLDTPGHEAFTAMRARGAQVTDIVVLVVAADDGVMEQTREAINHSKAAGVPIMVAVNKMDKPTADPDRVLRELSELGLQAESWGGDTVTANVSAKTRQGLDELLELLALQSDIMELKANPNKPARGHIVEAKLDKGRGPIATVLIQEGTLNQGDTFVCGVFSGRVRALFDDQGRKVKSAGPSMPVEVQGFEGVPEAGEAFICVTDDKLARRIAESRAVKQRERELAKESKVTLETFLSRNPDDTEAMSLNLVLKADVQGSLEAITEALLKQSTEQVKITVIHAGTGAITESDILLASASAGIIIGFNVRPTAKVKEVAETENVDIRFYDIIYKLVDDIRNAMTGMLAPVQREVYLGQADVRETFSVPKIGLIAGCHVSDGKLNRTAGARLLREGVVIYTGKISSLKRFKDDAREVLKGYECGVGLENFNDIKIDDVIEAFETVEEAATL